MYCPRPLRLRWIRIGQSTSEAVEVLAGLPIGAPVVRHPQPSFLDGGAVAGVDEEEWAYSPDGGR